MRTSRTWWNETKASPEKLRAWLRDQFRGEATAGPRIDALRDAFAAPGSRPWRILTVIADQERKHARWVGELLAARGEAVTIDPVAERYWPAVTEMVEDLASGAAVGAHAEKMRLARIEAIVADEDAPEDIRRVFAKILPDERFHERAFRRLAGEAALARTAAAHDRGRTLLGLAP